MCDRIDRATAAAAESTDDDYTRQAACLGLTGLQRQLDIIDETFSGRIEVFNSGEELSRAQLPGPDAKSKRGAGKSSFIAEGRDTPTSVINEELEVQKSTTAAGESREDLLPATLLLVATGFVLVENSAGTEK